MSDDQIKRDLEYAARTLAPIVNAIGAIVGMIGGVIFGVEKGLDQGATAGWAIAGAIVFVLGGGIAYSTFGETATHFERFDRAFSVLSEFALVGAINGAIWGAIWGASKDK